MQSQLTGKLSEIILAGHKLTPMMEQYAEIKKDFPETILLFRMGDFYEVFFEDAQKASKLLNIALTNRGKIADYPIPMAGIPHHAAQAYVDKITEQGHKAAICEQVEDPKTAKGVVKRAVTQVVSPGIPFDFEKTKQDQHYFIGAGFVCEDGFFSAFVDFTTGKFEGQRSQSEEEFCDVLAKFSPREFLTHNLQWEKYPLIAETLESHHALKTKIAADYFNIKHAQNYVEKLIPKFLSDKNFSRKKEWLTPVAALGFYLTSTQKLEEFPHLRNFRFENKSDQMLINLKTLKGLEIWPQSEKNKYSLLHFLDKTCSSMGARALKSLFLKPSKDLKKIQTRQKYVNFFFSREELSQKTREKLEKVRDVERIMAKVTTGKALNFDLINLAQTFRAYQELYQSLNSFKVWNTSSFLSESESKKLLTLTERIEATLNDEMGASIEKGNLVRKGYSKNRDKLARYAVSANDEMEELERKYRKDFDIPKLRLKKNNINGFFIEVSKSHSSKVPSHFVRRQTLVNAERYTTEELADFEKQVFSSKAKLEALEREIFQELLLDIKKHYQDFQQLSKVLGKIDVFQSLGEVARKNDFKQPTFHESDKVINVSGAWHPLIAKKLGEDFVKHDLLLNEESFFGLITGPNMAGKTTVMREMAIIQFLAQMGSFVPAQKAELGIKDALFSRLGASDDIQNGQSTFMVEMVETAEILRHATSSSFILLDEVGRGTSTHDGLSIAWALIEFLVSETQASCLFSTHYHELISLADKLPHAKNLTVETVSKNGNVTFLYNLIEKGANQSFGIYVASLAGLPKSLLIKAENLLHKLEKNQNAKTMQAEYDKGSIQLSFFQEEMSAVPEQKASFSPEERDWLSHFDQLDINNLTPLEALNALQSLKSQKQKLPFSLH